MKIRTVLIGFGAVVVLGALALTGIAFFNPFASADPPVTMGDLGNRPGTGTTASAQVTKSDSAIFIDAPGFSTLSGGREHYFFHYETFLQDHKSKNNKGDCGFIQGCDTIMKYTGTDSARNAFSGHVEVRRLYLFFGTQIVFSDPDRWRLSGSILNLGGANVSSVVFSNDPNADKCESHPCQVDHCFNKDCTATP